MLVPPLGILQNIDMLENVEFLFVLFLFFPQLNFFNYENDVMLYGAWSSFCRTATGAL